MTQKGFHLPGEWEKQSGVLITWPHNQSDWANSLSEIEVLYINLSRAICQYEKLIIITHNHQLQDHIQSLLTLHEVNLDNVIFHLANTNDTWSRDYGPICLTQDTKVKLLDFQFNGWGEKYSSELDNKITSDLLRKQTIHANKSERINFVLEGGSIDSDGNGTVLTTSSCLLSKSRNPTYSQEDIDKFLQTTLNIKQVLWLNEGYLAGDDTDSHIDVLARFVNKNTIVYIKCENENDEHYSSSLAMENQLKTFRNCEGKPYKLIPLPFTEAKYDKENRRLAASYANFLIINGAVLVPTYKDSNDEIALKIIQNLFVDRTIIDVPFEAAIEQNGSLHCLTMQLPDGVLNIQ